MGRERARKTLAARERERGSDNRRARERKGRKITMREEGTSAEQDW